VDLVFHRPAKKVRNPYALYVAFGRIDPQVGPPPCAQVCDHPSLLPDERGDFEHPDEYDALCHVASLVFGDEAESGSPTVFNQLVQNPDWQIGQVRTAGAFAAGLYETSDFIAALCGNDGEAREQFHASASTAVASRWSLLKQDVMRCLAGNEQWQELVGGQSSALDAETVEGNGGLHSLDEFVQHHAAEIHLLVQDYRQLMGICA
jgi:hypothetical protein